MKDLFPQRKGKDAFCCPLQLSGAHGTGKATLGKGGIHQKVIQLLNPQNRCYRTPVSQTLSSSASRAVCCACTCSYHIYFTSQAEWKGRNAEHVVFVLKCSRYVQSAFLFLFVLKYFVFIFVTLL